MTDKQRRALVYGPYVNLLKKAYAPRMVFTSPTQTNVLREPSIIIANHQCFADAPLILDSLQGGKVYTIAAEKLFKVPVLRKYLRALDIISVKQNSSQAAWFHAASEKIREGHSILIFPEGHKNYDGNMTPFQPGFVMLAAATGAPILPICISEAYSAFNTQQQLVFGAPIRLQNPEMNAGYLRAEAENAYMYMQQLQGYARDLETEEIPWPATLKQSCPQTIEER